MDISGDVHAVARSRRRRDRCTSRVLVLVLVDVALYPAVPVYALWSVCVLSADPVSESVTARVSRARDDDNGVLLSGCNVCVFVSVSVCMTP